MAQACDASDQRLQYECNWRGGRFVRQNRYMDSGDLPQRRKRRSRQPVDASVISDKKNEWLAEGRSLGSEISKNGWRIADWISRGREAFGPKPPTTKKAMRSGGFHVYHEQLRRFYAEAGAATGLSDSAMRQYHCLAKRFPRLNRVAALSFTHHLAVIHITYIGTDAKGRDRDVFDLGRATDILRTAEQERWPVQHLRRYVAGLDIPRVAKWHVPRPTEMEKFINKSISEMNPEQRTEWLRSLIKYAKDLLGENYDPTDYISASDSTEEFDRPF